MVSLGSSFASLIVWSGLLVGPPPLPATPAESGPEAPAEAGTPEGPEVPVEAEPAPAPAEPPAELPLVEPLSPAPVTPPEPEPELAPGLEADAHDRWVKVEPPRFRGTGLLIAAGVLYASAVAYQAGDSVLCGDCAGGFIERALMFTGMGLAAGGGVHRAHADAYDDTAFGRSRRDTRRTFIAGVALTGAGAVLGLVNEGLWWRCFFSGDGPYAADGAGNGLADCRYGVSRALLDVSVAATGTGLGLLSWSLTYRRDAKAYQRARVIGLRPTLGRDRFGLGLAGRF